MALRDSEICTGIVFGIYDALSPVADRTQLWMDTEYQPILWFSPVHRYRESTFLTQIPEQVLPDYIHDSESMLSHHCDNSLNVDKIREALAGDWTCSGLRAQQELGFQPRQSLQQRLNETADWYRSHGWV